MLLFISQRVNTLPPDTKNKSGPFQLINRLEWVSSLLAKSIKHGSIFLDVKTYNEIDGIRLDVELADSTFPRPFLVLPPHWPEGASADAAQRMHNRSFITTCSQKKNPWTAKPFLVELKTSRNGKTRPFAVGDSQCAGEGARGDGERLYFFQFCFLKIAVKQKSTLTWKIFRRSCTIQRTSPLKEKMSWPVPALSSQLLLQKSPWPGGVLSRSFTFCDYDASCPSFSLVFFNV